MDEDHEEKITRLLANAKEKSEENARAVKDITENLEKQHEDGDENGREQHLEGSTANSTIAIVIYGLNKHANAKEFESYLEKQQKRGELDGAFTYRKLKKPPGSVFATMSFDKIEDQELALKALKGLEFRKNVLRCEIKHHNRGGNKRDRDQGKGGGSDNGKKRSKNGGDDAEQFAQKTAKSAVAPWWDVPYTEQLQRKTGDMRANCLLPMVRNIRNQYVSTKKKQPKWLSQSNKDKEVLNKSVIIEDIIPCKEPYGYRNKCEFTFGPDHDGRPSLGFRVSSFPDVLVEPPYECPNIPIVMKHVVGEVVNFLASSNLGPYDQHHHTGCYRLLTCRYSRRTGGFILMLCVNSKDVDQDSFAHDLKTLVDLMQSLVELSSSDESASFNFQSRSSLGPPMEKKKLVTGFCYQVYDGVSVPPADHPTIQVFGDARIMEEMLGCKFEVSPQSFFQVNTPAAESLYSRVIAGFQDEMYQAEDTCVLDVCCGTGTIGICALKPSIAGTKTPMLLGIELCAAAVENANKNAYINGIETFENYKSEKKGPYAEFVCAKAENVLTALLKDDDRCKYSDSQKEKGDVERSKQIEKCRELLKGKRLLAIVDPPREGMHSSCLTAIRNCSRIERLVYVACNPTKSLVRDAIPLCGPVSKKYSGSSFKPVTATPVDLFPMTPHCEMIMIFDRYTEEAVGESNA